MVSSRCKRMVAVGVLGMLMQSNVYAGVVDCDASIYEPPVVEDNAPSKEEIQIEIKEMQAAIENIDTVNELNVEENGLHIENRDGLECMVDAQGWIRRGYSYDKDGNLYFADQTGALVKDRVYDDMHFEEDGTWVNPGMLNESQNRAWSEAIERGERVYIDGKDNLHDFMNFYMAQYRMRENCITMWADKRSYDADNYTVKLPYEMRYDREGLVNKIVENIGMPIGNSTKELTLSAVNNVCDYFEYDTTYTSRTMEDCIRDKRAVCWVYAKSVKALLDRCGIQSEIMTGFNSGTNHMWLRVKDGDKWLYCDPTAVDTLGWVGYFNINYNSFCNAWYPQAISHFKD